MKDLLCDEFQDAVRESLVRNKSILDIVARYQEASARTGRAVFKAATTCGCVRIVAEKPQISPDLSLQELRDRLSSHIEGRICDTCTETLEEEIGQHLFYLAALCNALDLNIYDILIKEHKKLMALGIFHAS
ncbi:MAG: DUF1573 domain-containing protein [Clostridia bacterium]|nr:DUF1573 domain-containing protein [Clostridia bacterium]